MLDERGVAQSLNLLGHELHELMRWAALGGLQRRLPVQLPGETPEGEAGSFLWQTSGISTRHPCTAAVVTDDSRKILFGQTAANVR
jgi:hypothetical protein